MKNIKIPVIMAFALLLSVGLFAQRGRGNNNHYNRGHQNKHYRPNYHYQPRTHLSIQVGPRYNYRPVYRPYYRPVYRNPGAYIHYGPVFGARINALPFGYSRVYVGSNPVLL